MECYRLEVTRENNTHLYSRPRSQGERSRCSVDSSPTDEIIPLLESELLPLWQLSDCLLIEVVISGYIPFEEAVAWGSFHAANPQWVDLGIEWDVHVEITFTTHMRRRDPKFQRIWRRNELSSSPPHLVCIWFRCSSRIQCPCLKAPWRRMSSSY